MPASLIATEFPAYCTWLAKRVDALDKQSSAGGSFAPSEAVNPIELAAQAYLRLCTIHPFADGNVRVCQMTMDFILLRAGLLPASLGGAIIEPIPAEQGPAPDTRELLTQVLEMVTQGVETSFAIAGERHLLAQALGEPVDAFKVEYAGRDAAGAPDAQPELVIGITIAHPSQDRLFVRVVGNGSMEDTTIKVFERKDLPPELRLEAGQAFAAGVQADRGRVVVKPRNDMGEAIAVLDRADRQLEPKAMKRKLEGKGYGHVGLLNLVPGETFSGKVLTSGSHGTTAVLKDGDAPPAQREVRIFTAPHGSDKLQPGMKIGLSLNDEKKLAVSIARPLHQHPRRQQRGLGV